MNEWFPEWPKLLSAHHVEVVGRGGRLAHLDIALLDIHSVGIFFDVDGTVVRIHHLQVAFDPARGVFWALAVLAVRQVDHQPRLQIPLGFSGHNAVVNHDLRTVTEVSELRFPNY